MSENPIRPAPPAPPIKGSAPGTMRRLRWFAVVFAAIGGLVLLIVKLWW